MSYALAFVLIAAGLIYLALRHGGWALLLLWPAASFAVVALGYAMLGQRVMGKDALGRYRWWARVPLLPFRLFTLGGWHIGRLLTRGNASSEILPGLWLGRRVAADELPPGTALVVDLTSEFSPPRRLLQGGRRYVCVPALDGTVPDESAAREALGLVAEVARAGGTVYIHCARGFGRSAAMVAAVLIIRGECRDVDEAQQRLSKLRPGVRLNSRQREFVKKLTET